MPGAQRVFLYLVTQIRTSEFSIAHINVSLHACRGCIANIGSIKICSQEDDGHDGRDPNVQFAHQPPLYLGIESKHLASRRNVAFAGKGVCVLLFHDEGPGEILRKLRRSSAALVGSTEEGHDAGMVWLYRGNRSALSSHANESGVFAVWGNFHVVMIRYGPWLVEFMLVERASCHARTSMT